MKSCDECIFLFDNCDICLRHTWTFATASSDCLLGLCPFLCSFSARKNGKNEVNVCMHVFLCISAYNLNYYMLCYSSRCYWCTLKDFLIMSPTSIHLFLKTFLQPRDHIVPLAGFAETSLPVCLGGTEGMSVVGSAGLLASSPGSGAGGRSLYASLFGIRRGGGGAGTDISSSSETKK